jgi:hypothetical protein
MSKADVCSIPIRSRRAVLAGIVSAAALPIAAAVPATALAMPLAPAAAPSGPHPDAELLAMADQYAVAYKKWSDLNLVVDRMDGSRFAARRDRPEVINWQEADAELGLPSLWPYPDDHKPIWDRPIDVIPRFIDSPKNRLPWGDFWIRHGA